MTSDLSKYLTDSLFLRFIRDFKAYHWTKDLYDLPPDELASIPTVCGSLREALNSLENDHEFLLQGDVFNVDQLEGYMDLKWEEVYAVEHTPHPVEYGLYYSL